MHQFSTVLSKKKHNSCKRCSEKSVSEGTLSNSVHWPRVSSSVLGVSRFPSLLLSFVGMSSHYIASVYSSLCSSGLHWACVIPLSYSECWDYRHMPTYLLLSKIRFNSTVLNSSFYTFNDLTLFLPHLFYILLVLQPILLLHLCCCVSLCLWTMWKKINPSGLFTLLESNLESWQKPGHLNWV